MKSQNDVRAGARQPQPRSSGVAVPMAIVSALRYGFALMLVIFLGAALTAQAALQFDVFLGYDGIVPEASWFPVVCEIKNDGPSFTGLVELTGDNFAQGQTRRM